MPNAKRSTAKRPVNEFPNMAAARAMDREQHVRQAMQAGMTRKQAERHADEEIREGDDE